MNAERSSTLVYGLAITAVSLSIVSSHFLFAQDPVLTGNSFGKGGMFGPYTPLQQLDVLADKGTKSYIVGSTNSLLLQQKDRYSDVLINVPHIPLDPRILD